MKRTGYLYEKIIDIENCREAIYSAAENKKRRKQVDFILQNAEIYARDLSECLQRLDFTSPYFKKIIKDGLSGKERELQIPAFYPDQCAHHAIMQVVKPVILKSSYYWSCANIPKRGIDHACKGVTRATLKDPKHAKYCVKMDVRKFYPSVDHGKLKECLRRYIKDKKALAILDTVIDSTESGLPIGNFTSPWFAEIFLCGVDHYIKEDLGVRYYVRYADDMVLIDNNKRKLRKAMFAVMDKLREMNLEIKHDYQLFRIYRDGKGRKIDFVGKCFGIGVTTIRKRRALVLMRQSRKIQKLQVAGRPVPLRMAQSFISRSSMFRYTDSLGMKKRYYDVINIKALKEVIRNESYRQYQTRCGGNLTVSAL